MRGVVVSAFRAFLSRDKQTVLMMTDRRREVIPAADLEKWRQFYRRLWGRGAKKPGDPGPYAKHYEHTCQVLDALSSQIKGGA